MLSLVRARLAYPAARLLRIGAAVNLPSALSGAGLLSLRLAQQSQRGIVSSASVWEPAAKKPAAKAKTAGRTTSKAKTTKTKRTVAAKKRPAKKAAPKKKAVAKPKKAAAKPKPTVSRKTIAELKPLKQAPSPYAIFLGKFVKASVRPKANIREVAEIGKEAGAVWNNMSEFEKKPFFDETELLRAAREKKLAAWSEKALQNGTDFRRINRMRVSKGRHAHHLPKAYRRPTTGFIRFYLESRAKLTSTTMLEQCKEASKLWKALGDSDRKVYSDQYQKELANFKKEHGMKA